MFRSLLRTLKHISFAVIAIVATVCIAEVGLNAHTLYQQYQVNGPKGCSFGPVPCPIAFQHLRPLAEVTHAAAGSGEPILIRTNSLGFRGDEVSVPKPLEVYRIVFLGDDETLAPDIAEEQTFPSLVQAALNEQSKSRPVEVINAGIPGYCPLLSLAWARRQLAGLQPDLVVLCCDLSDVDDDRQVRPLAKFAADGMIESVCHPRASQAPPRLLQTVEREFQLVALVRRHLGEFLDDTDSATDAPDGWESPDSTAGVTTLQLRQTWEPIASLRDLSHQLSADFVVVLVPSNHWGSANSDGPGQSAQILGEVTEEYGVPYLDVTAEFSPQASPPLFLNGTKALSANGHQIFAELLTWAIVQRGGTPVREESASSQITPAVASGSSSPIPTAASPLPTPKRRPRGNLETSLAE